MGLSQHISTCPLSAEHNTWDVSAQLDVVSLALILWCPLSHSGILWFHNFCVFSAAFESIVSFFCCLDCEAGNRLVVEVHIYGVRYTYMYKNRFVEKTTALKHSHQHINTLKWSPLTHMQIQTVWTHTEACILYMNPLTLWAAFHSPHQTKHCNLSPSLSQSDLRPLKVSRSVCGGQKCQSCGFQRRAERLLCGGRLLCYICYVSVRGVLFFLGSMCACWSTDCLGWRIWAELSWAERFWREQKKLSHPRGSLRERINPHQQQQKHLSTHISRDITGFFCANVIAQ